MLNRRWWARRLVVLAAVLTLVSAATFALLVVLPGDPVVTILGPQATPAAQAELRHELGLDRPVATRYLRWAGDAMRGDLGVSYQTNQPVADSLRQRLPVSLELLACAQILALAGAVVLAVVSALRVGTITDRLIAAGSFAGLAVPNFAVGVALIAVFVVRLGWFDTFGYVPWRVDLLANLRGMVLPSITLALPLLALYTRVLRGDLLRALSQDHVLQARLNGLSPSRIVVRHGLRQSLATLLTVVGLNVSSLLGGAVVIESLFALPGIGRLLFSSIRERDYLVTQGAVLVIAACYVVANVLVELAQRILDPRLGANAERTQR